MPLPLVFAQLPGARELNRSELTLSLGVLVFTLILVLAIAVVALKKEQGWSATSTKLIVISLVVGGSLFLLTAGYSQDQMTQSSVWSVPSSGTPSAERRTKA